VQKEMKRSKFHQAKAQPKSKALRPWRASHKLWRASRPTYLCYERNTWCDGRHTILLYFWLQKRNKDVEAYCYAWPFATWRLFTRKTFGNSYNKWPI
jgi:hypothetical protein